MREIMKNRYLFKAKKIDNGEWVEGSLVVFGENDCAIMTKDDMEIAYASHGIYDGGITEVVADTICQYTGLTDKNGNKIWENDIVKDKTIHLLGSVEYDEEHGMYVINEVNDGYQNFQEFWSCTEVIGNIFDNEDLLKGE